MFVLTMNLQRSIVIEMLVAGRAVGMKRALHVMPNEPIIRQEVHVALAADIVEARIVFVLVQGIQATKRSVAPIAEGHLD